MARKKRKSMAEINVVPYIDVMLVLLIIFMITAPMLTQGVKVDLPKANTKPMKVKKDEEHVIVSILPNGEYVLERGKVSSQRSTLEEVEQYVKTVLSQQPQTQVLVRGDENVLYGKVIALMSTIQTAGAESVGLVTEAPPIKK